MTGTHTPAFPQPTIAKPVPLQPIPENIPPRLRAGRQHAPWRYELVNGRWTKRPYMLDGRHASSTNDTTWSTFPDAYAAYQAGGYDGVGRFQLANQGLVGLDEDHVVEDGHLNARGQDRVRRFPTYWEWSPSGEGIRGFIEATLPNDKGRKHDTSEVYSHARFLSLTGHVLDGALGIITSGQDALDAYLDEVFPKRQAAASVRLAPIPSTADDQTILDRARNRMKTGAKFARLFDQGDLSDYAGDDSSAELGLCNLLRYEVGPDASRIDRLVRQSALHRTKWDEPRGDTTYGAMTIDLALPGDVYEERTLAPILPPASPAPVATAAGDPSPLQDAIGPPADLAAEVAQLRAANAHLTARVGQLEGDLAECRRVGTAKVREARRETALVRGIFRNPHLRSVAPTLVGAIYNLNARRHTQGIDPTEPQPMPCETLADRTKRSTGQVSRDLAGLKERGLVVVAKESLPNGHQAMRVAMPALANGLIAALETASGYAPAPTQALPQHGGDRRERTPKLAARLTRVTIPACDVHDHGLVKEDWQAICAEEGCGAILAERAAFHSRLQDATPPAEPTPTPVADPAPDTQRTVVDVGVQDATGSEPPDNVLTFPTAPPLQSDDTPAWKRPPRVCPGCHVGRPHDAVEDLCDPCRNRLRPAAGGAE